MKNRINAARRLLRSADRPVLEGLEQRRHLANEVVTATPGGLFNGTINTVNEVDTIRFDAAAGQQFLLSLQGAKTVGNFSVRARIVAPSGASETISSTSFATFYAAETGLYQAQIHDFGGNDFGTYSFGLERINAPSADALPIHGGLLVNGTLGTALQLDQYTFDVAAGEQVDVLLGGQTTFGNFSVRAWLFDRVTGQRLGTISSAQTRFTFSEARQLSLAVYDFGGDDLGTYHLAVERVNALNADTLPIAGNGILTGTIGAAGRVDHYRLAAKAGQTYLFDLNGVAITSGFSIRGEIFNRLGQRLDAGGRGTLGFTATADEDYYVQIYDYGYNDTGTYQLTVTGFPPERSILRVDGTDGHDVIDVQRAGNQYKVVFNGQTSFTGVALTRGIEVRGNGGNDRITIGPDVPGVYVLGGAGRDLIVGGDGDDVLNGGGGNDTIHGGLGDDRIVGAAGHDQLFGSNGRDRIYGGEGDDFIDGGNHADRIWGENGNDTLVGGKHDDRIYAGAGVDLVLGGQGRDVLSIKRGIDTIDNDDEDEIAHFVL